MERVLRHWDLPAPATVRLVAESFNTIYRLSVPGEDDLLLRVGPQFRLHPDATFVTEAIWLDALRADVGMAVPRVVPAGRNAFVDEVLDGTSALRRCSVLTWTTGEPLSLQLTAERIQEAGALLGILHEHANGWTVPPGLAGVPRLDTVLPFQDARRVGVDEPHRVLFAEAYGRAEVALRAIWEERLDHPHLLHGDFTPVNVIVGPSGLVPIDFQDLAVGLAVQDIAMAIMPLTKVAPDGTLREAFRRGYEAVRKWPEVDEAMLQSLYAVRRLAMANLTLHLRKPGWQAHLDFLAAGLAAWMEDS